MTYIASAILPPLAAILIGTPISIHWRLSLLPTGMLVGGIEILIAHWFGLF